MAEVRTGGCQCGQLRYEISGDPVVVAACHCTQCQSQSGSAFSMSVVVPSGCFRWLSGEAKTWQTVADSGAEKRCVFCPECGVRIYNALGGMPVTVNVKPGTLDDTSGIEPQLHVWLASRQAWVPLPEQGARFEHNPGASG